MNVLVEPLMTEKQPRYLSYLLRLWQTGGDEERTWCASLETPGVRERRGFASLEDLFEFLASQTGVENREGRDSEGRDGR
jgi:hypothetical protein